MEEAFPLLWRTLVVYLLLVAMTHIMGKREIGALSPMDLVVTILLADAAILAVEDLSRSFWIGLIPAVTLVAAEVILSYLGLHIPWVRDKVSGRPSMIIENGRINQAEMRRQRYNLRDLMMQLRENNATSIDQVQYAILEPNGILNVYPYPKHRPITPADLNLKVRSDDLPLSVILDGQVDASALEATGKSREWIDEELNKLNVDLHDVLLAQIDPYGKLHIKMREPDRVRS